jgi:uncharacterized protein (DUF58 family)
MIFALLIPLAGSIALIAELSWWPVVLVLDASVAVFLILDLSSLPRAKRFRATRDCSQICSLGELHRVTLHLENRSRRSYRIEVRDDRLPTFEVDPEEFSLVVPGHSRANVHYNLKPLRRGTYELRQIHLRVPSRLGFWRRIHRYPAELSLRVYPDLKQISRYALYARLNRLSLLGVRKTRRVGGDNEFERLREYTPDDNYRNIDWRATGRRRKLVVRDYQSNQSQRVVFLIDSGRMMVNESAGLSLLDHALDAMLMLAHVAVTRGDQVGLLTFSDRIHHWVPLGNGNRHVNRMVHAVHNLFPTLVESRYDSAFLHLNRHCRKRTLVILITNVIDEVNAAQISAHLKNMVGAHLPLGILLRDNAMFDAVAVEDAEGDELYRAAAAAHILDWRQQVITNLRHAGVLTLDVFAEKMTAPLINEYLKIKARHLL